MAHSNYIKAIKLPDGTKHDIHDAEAVHAISTGSSDGTISVDIDGTLTDVAVRGLGSAAYTASTDYEASGTAQTKAEEALNSAKLYADDLNNSTLEALEAVAESKAAVQIITWEEDD